MKILVDADACPVKEIIVKIAKEWDIPVWMFTDTSHILEDDYSRIVIVGQGKDSVDFALINQTQREDIVVTQDYGVASMALSKGAHAIHPGGLIYDSQNMDRLLFERYLAGKVRRAGGRTSSIRKRTRKDNLRFDSSLRALCRKLKTHGRRL